MEVGSFSRAFCFLLESGEVAFPCTMKNRSTGKSTFRVSRFGGNQLNHADEKKREEEVNEEEMVRLVLEQGCCVRVQKENGEKNIFSPSSTRVIQVYVPLQKS